MIYKGGYRRAVAQKQLKSGGLTLFQNILMALLSVVLTVLIHFSLIVMTRDDAGAAVSGYLYTAYYGTLYIYTFVNFIGIFFLLLVKVRALCFPEITTNRWNLLTSMGIPIAGLVGAKLYSTIFALLRQYLFGYLLTMFCGYLFGFEFHINYLIALFFVGCINLVLLFISSTALSVFVKKEEKARVNLFFGMLMVVGLNLLSGFYSFEGTLTNGNLAEMFALRIPSYITVAAVAYVVCYAVILIVAKTRAHRQELMPLGVFEIKPLVSGSETELFMTEGMKHTTILDTELLRDQREESNQMVEKPDMATADESAAFPYGLMIALAIALAAFCGISAVLSLVLPNFIRPILGTLLGEGFATAIMAPAGLIILGLLAAVFAALTVLMFIRRKRERSAEDS